MPITIYVGQKDKELLGKLDRLCRKIQRSRSFVVKEMMRQFFDHNYIFADQIMASHKDN